jgi:hypothetical protein
VELGAGTSVTVVRTGGVTGVRLEATVAWSDLDEEARAELERALAAGDAPAPRGPDRMAYEVVVRTEREERRCLAGEEARHAAEAVLRAARA